MQIPCQHMKAEFHEQAQDTAIPTGGKRGGKGGGGVCKNLDDNARDPHCHLSGKLKRTLFQRFFQRPPKGSPYPPATGGGGNRGGHELARLHACQTQDLLKSFRRYRNHKLLHELKPQQIPYLSLIGNCTLLCSLFRPRAAYVKRHMCSTRI